MRPAVDPHMAAVDEDLESLLDRGGGGVTVARGCGRWLNRPSVARTWTATTPRTLGLGCAAGAGRAPAEQWLRPRK
jgi:hypothetical protein